MHPNMPRLIRDTTNFRGEGEPEFPEKTSRCRQENQHQHRLQGIQWWTVCLSSWTCHWQVQLTDGVWCNQQNAPSLYPEQHISQKNCMKNTWIIMTILGVTVSNNDNLFCGQPIGTLHFCFSLEEFQKNKNWLSAIKSATNQITKYTSELCMKEWLIITFFFHIYVFHSGHWIRL